MEEEKEKMEEIRTEIKEIKKDENKSKGNNRVLIILAISMLLLILAFGIYFVLAKTNIFKTGVKDKTELTSGRRIQCSDAICKRVVESDEFSGKSYIGFAKREFSFDKDLSVPEVLLDSPYAKEINLKIDKIIERYTKNFKDEYSAENPYGEAIGGKRIKYEVFENDEIASILIEETTLGTDVAQYEYYSFNINLDTEEEVSFEEIVAKLGITDIEKRAHDAILKSERIKSIQKDHLMSSDGTLDEYKKTSLDAYDKSVSDNTIKYFVDSSGKLNIIPILRIPAGREYFETIVVVE